MQINRQRAFGGVTLPILVSLSKVFGGNVGGVIPDPIPNSEVKPSRADGTARVTAWESRTPPELIPTPHAKACGVFLLARPRGGLSAAVDAPAPAAPEPVRLNAQPVSTSTG